MATLASSLKDAFAAFLAPLVEGADDPRVLADWLATLGHTDAVAEDPALVTIAQQAAALAGGLASLSESQIESWEGITALVEQGRQAAALLAGLRAFAADPARDDVAAGLAEELMELLLASFLRRRYPLAFRVACVLALVEPFETAIPDAPIVDGMTTRRYSRVRDRIRFDALGDLLSRPGETLAAVYLPNELAAGADAWLAAERLFPALSFVADLVGLPWHVVHRPLVPPAASTETGPAVSLDDHGPFGAIDFPAPEPIAPPPDEFLAAHYPTFRLTLARAAAGDVAVDLSASSRQHPGAVAGFIVTPLGELSLSETRGDWTLTLTAAGSVPAIVVGRGGASLAPADHPLAAASARLVVERAAAAGEPAFVFGSPTGARVEIGALRVSVAVVYDGDTVDLQFAAEASSAALVLASSDSDPVVLRLLPGGPTRIPFDLGLLYSTTRGLTFKGAGSLDASVPGRLTAGPITLDAIRLSLATAPEAVTARAACAVGLDIGPVHLVADGVGVQAALRFPADGGNFGLANVDAGLATPTGLGLALTGGPLRGGGFVEHDPATGRYSGVLELFSGDVGIDAVGIIDGNLPGGGYALLVSLRAEFPAIPIGLGFALNGVGGLIALNRRIDVDGLRARFADGTIGRILRPEDPVKNAPALIADLDRAFPVHRGTTVVGPTVRAVWAGLVDFDLGVFLELPGPSRAVILGSARADIVHDDRTYVALRVDVLGVIDFAAATVAFDAVLVDSHLLGTLDLTGGAAFRLCWGDSPYAVFSVGGFHPGYHPEPLVFPPTLTRVAMVHGKPDDTVYMRLEGYFAVTTNTLQFGAAAELRISYGGWSIRGAAGFDALIQFVPFHFEVDIRASVHVAYRGHDLAGLTLTGSLSGPGPVLLQAKVCIDLWLFDICFSHTFEIGSGGPPPLPLVADLFEAMVAAIGPDQLHGGGVDPLVRLGTTSAIQGRPVLSPVGAIVWEQHLAPFDLAVSRVAGGRLPVETVVHAASPVTATVEQDYFAPGQYLDLSDDEKLTRPTYQRFGGGLRWGESAPIDGVTAQVPVTVREIRLPASHRELVLEAFPPWLVGGLPATVAPAVTVRPESWSVVTSSGVTSGLSITVARAMVASEPGATAVVGDGVQLAVVF